MIPYPSLLSSIVSLPFICTPLTALAGDPLPSPCNQLELVSSIKYPHATVKMQIQGNRAYTISDSQTHFSIFDITDPTSITLLSDTQVSNNAQSYFVRGDYAYILSNNGGFSIYDIRDEYDPWYVRGHTLLNSSSMVFSQDIIYGRERLLNITRPRSPRLTDSPLTLPFGYNGETILVDHSNIYTDRLARYDITDPLVPVLTSPTLLPFGTLKDIIIVDSNTIYGRSNQTLYAFDQSNPNEITLTGTFSTGSTDFAVRGSLIYTVGEGLRIFDFSNPNDPMEIAYFEDIPGLGSLTQIERIDDLFYITDDVGTLAVYRINTNPIATHPTQDQALEIKLLDNLALIADNSAGLQIFDISNPQSPTLLSTFPTNNTAVGVDAIPGVAFVATHQAGLDIVDISDPSNPTLITNYDTTRSTQDVQIVDNYAYVVDRVTGLHILDISDPSSPQVLSITDTPNLASDITISDNLALVSQGRFNLQIMDISDRANPQIISTITPIDTISEGIDTTTVHNGLLYTAENSGGYRVFDFSNPASPIEIASINTGTSTEPGFGHEIVIQNNRLILTNGSAGLSIYNNTDPTSPVRINFFPARININAPSSSSYRKLMMRDSLAYIAAFNGGLRIIDINDCTFPCDADLNGDTVLDFFDVTMFVGAFREKDPIADFTNDGIFDFFDISIFLSFFSTGCP